MSDTVTITLAHPLSIRQSERLRAKEARDYNTGDKITVPRDDARAIINAGFADGVDPENHEQVRAALDGTLPAKSAAKAATKAPASN